MVTQASWVQSLLNSFIKRWEGQRISIGDLFGSTVDEHRTVLPWTRTEQAAFLILVGQALKEEIFEQDLPWTQALRKNAKQQSITVENDPAFFGPHNLLNNDQGLRVLLQVVNGLFFVRAGELELHKWGGKQHDQDADEQSITDGLESLKQTEKIQDYVKELAKGLAFYDWRTFSAPNLNDEQKTLKATFRGSGGYRELRRDVLQHLSHITDVLRMRPWT